MNARLIKYILLTGLLVGTLDGITPMIVYQLNPVLLFRVVASGAFGKDAFTGSDTIALWGLFFHLFIAMSWTVLFYLIFPKIAPYSKNKFITGLLYGIVVWVVMNLVVVPMSNVTPRDFTLAGVLKGMIILMLMVGLPISILAHRYYSRSHAEKRAVNA
jgi:hypothetical protein